MMKHILIQYASKMKRKFEIHASQALYQE